MMSIGDEPEIRNAIITAAGISCGDNDRGTLGAWLTLDYGGMGQCFGGWVLYLPKSYDHHSVMSVAGHFIFRCMEIAGVDDWSKMKGRTIRVKADWNKVRAIGHIIKDDWFDPQADFDSVKKGGA